MITLLLAACAEPVEKPDTAPSVHQQPVCEPAAEPAATELAWEDPGPGGVSAQDVLGFGIGTFTATLHWDDGATDTATLTVTPGTALQTITGPQESCPVAITGNVTWALSTDDGRVAATGEGQWIVSDAGYPPGGESFSSALDRGAVGFTLLNAGSTLHLRMFLDGQGTLVSVSVEEMFPLGTDTNRDCVRASLDPAALVCTDHTEGTGPD